MSHCLSRLEYSRNTTILPDCIHELFEVEVEEDRNNSMGCCHFIVGTDDV